MRILVAEDDAVSRLVLLKILANLPGTSTSTAEDGAAAWALLDDPGRSFDILFLDLEMPKMNGFEILRRVHESPFLRSLHVVLCTGANDRATVLRAAQLGAKHYIVKPCTETVVSAKLLQLQSADPRLRTDQHFGRHPASSPSTEPTRV